MLENEVEIVEERVVVKVPPDPEVQVKRELEEHPEILEAAAERKKRKFAPSGLILLLIGVTLIAIGLTMPVSTSSLRGFLVGVGVIVLIIGMCRILIGLIKPIVPSQIR